MPVTATRVIDYQPPTTWAQQATGYCWVASLAVGRPDAYRCMQGNAILDPCFAVPSLAQAVICPPPPPDPSPGTRIDLTQPPPLGASGADGRALPWAMQLEDGQVCAMVTGATGTVGGKRLAYACTDGRWVIDFREGPVWIAEMTPPLRQWSSPTDPDTLLHQAVRRVWK